MKCGSGVKRETLYVLPKDLCDQLSRQKTPINRQKVAKKLRHKKS